MAKRAHGAAVLAVVAVLALAGCTGPVQRPLDDANPRPPVGGTALPPGPPEGGGGELDPAAMQAEFDDEVAKLTWPPGVTPPQDAPEPPPMPDVHGVVAGNSYEAGYGRSVAGSFWLCAWAREWLTQRGQSPDREAAALVELNTLPEIYFYQSVDPQSRPYVDEMLRQTTLGDPTMIANHLDNNCRFGF